MSSVLVFIILAGSLFGGWYYAFPRWESVQRYRAEIREIENAEQEAHEIIGAHQEVLERLREVSDAELARLDAMIPPKTDQEDLYLFFQEMAAASGMQVKNLTITEEAGRIQSGRGTLSFTIDVMGPYEFFRVFLDTIENNLRVTDITAMDIKREESGDYTVILKGKTYYGR